MLNLNYYPYFQFSHLKTLLEFMYRGEISIDEKDLSEILKVAEALSIRGLSSFESDDEDGNSEQLQDKSPEGSSTSAGTTPANPTPNNQSPQQPLKPTQSHQPSTNQNDNQQNFYRHHQSACDVNGTAEVEERKAVTRGHGKKPKATHKITFDTKTGLPVKRKRGRQPKNQSLGSSAVELRPPILSELRNCSLSHSISYVVIGNFLISEPQESYVTDVKPVLSGKTSGVRRRIPKKYSAGLKRVKLSHSGGRSVGSEYRNFGLAEDESPDSPMELLNSEPLTEGR